MEMKDWLDCLPACLRIESGRIPPAEQMTECIAKSMVVPLNPPKQVTPM